MSIALNIEEQESTNQEAEDYFGFLEDIQGFKAWIMATWFDCKKHSEKFWYSPFIDKECVLDYIINTPVFPYTPHQLVDMWVTIPRIRNSLLTSSDEDFEILENLENKKPMISDAVTYRLGESTLTEIGKELGDLSATMANKIEDVAEEKIRRLLGGDINGLDNDLNSKQAMKRIREARVSSAVDYATFLKHTDNIKDFFGELVKTQLLSASDLEHVTEDELLSLELLRNQKQEVIEWVLLEDIDEHELEGMRNNKIENVFKTFQNVVAKRVFPHGKFGSTNNQEK